MRFLPPLPYAIAQSMALLFFILSGANAYAKETPSFSIDITDNGFIPSVVTIPAGQKVSLAVRNGSKLPVEFESYSLNREKIVPAGSRIRIWIGPLKPGKYPFFNDFNPSQTGQIVAVKGKRNTGNAQ